MKGYTGSILRINLTTQEHSTINTADYEQWGGGHGMGSALFWDLVPDKTVDGFDPGNVVTLMTSPLTGTLALAGGARMEVQGIGVQSYPTGWFTRSGMGGRFGPMMKFAGWDGVVIEGRADRPVWVDIRDGEVQIKDAAALWGLDTWETQQNIWQAVEAEGDWAEVGTTEAGPRTTQQPAVLCIGPAGENLCRVACLVHDAGNAAGQGGFGAVWGSKNLKAISVIGTGHISVAEPGALFEARQWAMDNYGYALEEFDPSKSMWQIMPSTLRSFPVPLVFWQRPVQSRPQACTGCQAGCRCRHDDGVGNESSCKESGFYRMYNLRYYGAQMIGSLVQAQLVKDRPATLLQKLYEKAMPPAQKEAADLAQRYGINAGEPETGIPYLRSLYKEGVIGPGKEIDCDLPFDDIGSSEFVEKLLHMMAYREGVGDDMAEGFARAAKRWGRLEQDMKTGLLNNCHWGVAMHYDPRVSLEWGYGTILGDRDINEHGLNPLYMTPTVSTYMGGVPLPAEDFVKLFSEKTVPYTDDLQMFDFSNDNMYSEHIAKLVAWHRHYSRFWIQSALYCDNQYPDIFNWGAKDHKGLTGEGEPKFYNAVTGADLSLADGIEIGRKIWNLDNAIWTLQGRHRDVVKFADYIYDVDSPGWGAFTMPVRDESGQWTYESVGGRRLDRTQFEAFKTRYYELEGWDPESGWPTRSTLESLGLQAVADELESNTKIGKESP